MSRLTASAAGERVTVDYSLSPAPFYDLAADTLASWTRENGQASNTFSYDKAANVTLAGGVMSIRGARETAPNGAAYTSGDALARHVKVSDYFVAEVTARLPYGPGIWPCPLWFRPLTDNVGEIDVVEQFGTQPYMKATLHNAYGAGHKTIGATKKWATLGNPSPTAEHTWRIVKARNLISVSVDGTLFATFTPASAPAGFDWAAVLEAGKQWYPRITLQLGSTGAAGDLDPSFTSCVMQVSRLRIWNTN
jgi:hypothetical protein